jgi:peptide/nickel transport system permease protein
MLKYIIKRIIQLVPVIIGASAIIFFIISMSDNDPVIMLLADSNPTPEQIELTRQELGLDKPLVVQFANYMKGFLTGDLGKSYSTGRPVFQEYMLRLPATIKLAFWALLVSVVIAIPIGIISAVKQYSFFDNLGMTISLLGVATPNFWLGLMLILLFAVNLGWLPSGGPGGLKYIILPAITLGTGQAGLAARMTRSSMLEIIRQDYIRTARAKGLAEKTVILRHALKNALIPIITVLGSQFGHALGGAMITETVFSWPGVGRLMIEAINKYDRPTVIGCVIMLCIMISVINLIVDILYAFIDPRVRTEYSK